MEKKKPVESCLEDKLILIPFAISVILTLVAFVLRVAKAPSGGLVTALSYYAYAWVCCLCMSQCVFYDKHLQISLFDNIMPKGLKKVADGFNHVIGFLVVLGVFVGSVMLLMKAISTGATDPKFPQIPQALGYAAPVFGFGLALVRYILRAVKGAKK